MKIAVVSPGRSHLLDMSIMHIKNGHDVTFYTMVSKKRCKQFGFPAERVVSFFYICAPLIFIFRQITAALSMALTAVTMICGECR